MSLREDLRKQMESKPNVTNFSPMIPDEVLENVQSGITERVLSGLKYVDKYLNDHQKIGNRVVIDAGIIPMMLNIIQTNDIQQPELLYEAAVCVSCISAGAEDETLLIQESNIVPFIYKVFDSTYENVWDYRIKGQIGLIVGNIAGNSLQSRDYILLEHAGYQTILTHLLPFQESVNEVNEFVVEREIIVRNVKAGITGTSTAAAIGEIDAPPPITNEITTETKNIKFTPKLEMEKNKLAFIRTLIWTISNFYRWKPRPTYHEEKASLLLDLFATFWNIKDFEIQRDIAWFYSYITDIDNKNMNAILKRKLILEKAHHIIFHEKEINKKNYLDVLHPVLRLYGNLSSGSEIQTQVLVDHNLLPRGVELLKNYPVEKIQQEICFIASNVLMGSIQQRQWAIESKILPVCFELFLMSPAEKVRKEAAWVLNGLVNPSIEPFDSDLIGKIGWSKNSPSHQEYLRYFVLSAITGLEHEGYETVAKDLLEKVISLQRKIFFLFDHSNI